MAGMQGGRGQGALVPRRDGGVEPLALASPSDLKSEPGTARDPSGKRRSKNSRIRSNSSGGCTKRQTEAAQTGCEPSTLSNGCSTLSSGCSARKGQAEEQQGGPEVKQQALATGRAVAGRWRQAGQPEPVLRPQQSACRARRQCSWRARRSAVGPQACGLPCSVQGGHAAVPLGEREVEVEGQSSVRSVALFVTRLWGAATAQLDSCWNHSSFT